MDDAQRALIVRIEEKLAQHGMSDREASMMATGRPDLIRDLRRKRTLPRADRIQALANVLGTTADWLLGGVEAPPSDVQAPPRSVGERQSSFTADDAFPRALPRDVPILGTPSCGHISIAHDGTLVDVETIDIDAQGMHDFARRPIGLMGRKDAYAIFYTGYSMIPKFEPNELGFVDPKIMPSIGDYVVVQLRSPDEEDGERIVSALVKRLIRRTASYLELEQFHPALTFRLPMERVARVHRILTMNELAGV